MRPMSALALLAAAAALALSLLAPSVAQAREGQSAGHGIKCYWVLGADGVYHQVCRKGI